jgi:phage host-nuclease inhibitor protein Gam
MSIEKLGNIKTEISEKEGELKQKQIDFINETNSNVKKNIKKDIKTLEKAIKDLNNDYDKEISDNGNEIKVEAYFTKDKNKTRVKQTFTISEDGIN